MVTHGHEAQRSQSVVDGYHHHISIGCQLVTRELVGGSWNE